MKRKCNWLAAILFLVLLCGCDGRQGDLLLAQAIYQEQEAQAVQLRILCLESEPSANAEDAQPKPVLLAGKGVTLEEAWQAAQQQAGGQVFLGQCRVWMLGLGQAKQLNPEDAEFWMQQDPGCGSMDLWLVEETSRYMFRILAAKMFFEDPASFGFYVREKDKYPVEPKPKETVSVSGPIENLVDFAEEHGIRYATLKGANLWLRDSKLTNKAGKTYEIVIPREDR